MIYCDLSFLDSRFRGNDMEGKGNDIKDSTYDIKL
jgi:hypothetical protein